MGYLFAAYAVFWALTFVLVFVVSSRQKRLQKKVEALRQAVKDREEAAG